MYPRTVAAASTVGVLSFAKLSGLATNRQPKHKQKQLMVKRPARTVEAPEGFSVASRALDIMAIAESPLFAHRARLAHELGLLAPLLAGDSAEVSRRSCELLST